MTNSSRGQWKNSREFVLSCVSMSVGLGNIWRFPYVAYKNGGGAFLIPYLILLFVIGRPLYFLELVIGQFSSRGPVKVWKCVPAFKGIGYAQLATNIYVSAFYNFLMALTLYYFFASFSDPLPWSVCDPKWPGSCLFNETTTKNGTDLSITSLVTNRTSFTNEYFYYTVTKKTPTLGDMSMFSWELAACLLLSWTLVFLSTVRGVQSLGKVAYFTAIFPYVILVAMLIGALTRDGAIDGIIYFFKPDWSKLFELTVWFQAVQQSFFSLGVCFGSLIMYSSYQKFRNDVYRDALIVSCLDTFTSVLAGCVIFAVLGSMAHQQGVTIDQVGKKDDVGLAFVAFPEALMAFGWWPNLWSILFFIMLFTLGIGSSVAQIETVCTVIRDQFPFLYDKKALTSFATCSVLFLFGLTMTNNAGLHVMKLLNDYGVGITAFLYGIIEVSAIMYIYGYKSFFLDIEFMLSRPVGIFWRTTWVFITPIMLAIIFIIGNVNIIIDPLAHDLKETGLPVWGFLIGYGLALFAVIQIPVWMYLVIRRQDKPSFVQKLKASLRPTKDWGPREPQDYKDWKIFKEKKLGNDVNTLQVIATLNSRANSAFEPDMFN